MVKWKNMNPRWGARVEIEICSNAAAVTTPASKHGTSHTWLFDAFIPIADQLHMFYHITLGIVILKWGEPSLLVKAVRN